MKKAGTKNAKKTTTDIFAVDRSNMFDILTQFPQQVRDALVLGEQAPYFPSEDIRNIVVLGMGGSAIGGDLLRSYITAIAPGTLPVSVSRGYTLPPDVDERTAILASSYSGDTEETLAAFEAARKKTKNILVSTTGGQLAKRAAKFKLPVIGLPPGYQPRCAIAFAFFPVLTALLRHNALGRKAGNATTKAIAELLPLLDEKAALYSKPGRNNPAFVMAKQLHGTLPVVYSSSDILDTVNLRWRGQMHENAKQLAFGNLVPEMNHNEINSWNNPPEIVRQTSLVLLRDTDEHERVAVRFEAMKSLIGKKAKNLVEARGEGEHLLTRMITLLYLGDWMSYYLALLNGVDPTEIPLIMKLKQRLASV